MLQRESKTTSDRLSTGDDQLDRQVETGLRTGSLLALRAPPGSQSEAILYTLMQARPTLYISTLRREDAVRRDLERSTGPRAQFEAASIAGGTFLDDAFELVQSVDRQVNVIFNPVTPLERSDKNTMYQRVLNELKERVVEVDGLGVLHCIDHDDAPMLREQTLTTADIVWNVEPIEHSNEQKYHLSVSKNRGEPIVREKIELALNRRIVIDDTRNI